MKLSPAAAPDKPETAGLDLDAFLPFQLSITANAVSDAIARAYRRRFGLRVAEWRVLAILAQSPGLTPNEVGGRARLDKITVSRAARTLLTRGLLAATATPGDRRSHRLALTAAGDELYRAVVPAARAMEAQVTHGLSAGEVAQLAALLARVRAATEG